MDAGSSRTVGRSREFAEQSRELVATARELMHAIRNLMQAAEARRWLEARERRLREGAPADGPVA